MKPRIAPAYLETLFESGTHDALVELSTLLACSYAYKREETDCGLGSELFVLGEALLWLAQSARSGMGTYLESTSPDRQDSMLRTLEMHAPAEMAAAYSHAVGLWRKSGPLSEVDDWILDYEPRAYAWLTEHVRLHRAQIGRLVLMSEQPFAREQPNDA
jgi:hypothetical protein